MEISLFDIVCYIGEGVRPLKEGEEVFLAGHVNLCNVQSEVKKLRVQAECLQSSKLSGPPHKIVIAIDDTNDAKYIHWNCGCSCKAGLGGKCKHIVAVLLAINRIPNADLILSCTDVGQRWGKRKREAILEVVPLDEFCHVPKVEAPKSLQERNFLQMFLAEAPLSEAAIHFKCKSKARKIYHCKSSEETPVASTSQIEAQRLRYVESLYEHAKSAPYIEILQEEDTTICLQQCCVQTYNSLFPCEAKEVCQRTFTDKEAWGQERQYRVTASRCYSLFTYSLSEWEGKSEKYFFGQTFENEATRYGISQEKLAKEAYSRQKGDEVVEFGFCVCQTQPWMGVSPDGIIFLGGKPKKLLEIKCPVAGKTKTILEVLSSLKYLKKDGDKFDLRKKSVYYGQIQMCLCCLGLTTCDLCIYSSFDCSMYIIKVDFDYNFCYELLPKLRNIFFTKMLHVLCQKKK